MAILGTGLQVDPGGDVLQVDSSGDILQVTGSLVPLSAVQIKLITSEHNAQPNYMAMVAATCQPFFDTTTVAMALPALFDLDAAVGAQLDAVGLWIGLSRAVDVPITGVFFSFDMAGLGFDQAAWESPEDPGIAVESMSDDVYRLALEAKALLNRWDGTVAMAYEALDPLVSPGTITITDNTNMTITVTLAGSVNPIVTALLRQQLISFRPGGVQQIGP
jgi:hypothetical protein